MTTLHKDLKEKLGQAAEKLESSQDPVKWIESEFYIPETKNDPVLKGRFKLMPHQADLLREIFRRDENGMFPYSTIVWSDIKKSWKSSIAAAVNLFRAEHTEWGEFYVIANDLKQAESRVHRYIRRAIALNPRLKRKYRSRGYRITSPSGSILEAIPVDPSGEAGSNADMVTFSELWGALEEAKEAMWSEMNIPPGKFGKAFRWVESYAGFTGKSNLLYTLWQLGVEQGELLWPDRLYPVTGGEPKPLEVYVNKKARMLCYWGTVPRLPDQTAEYYATESMTMPPNQFQRIHRNQWSTDSDTYIPIEWWDACDRTKDWPSIQDISKHPMVISVDAAVSGDSTSVWMGCRHPDKPDEVMEFLVKIWKPPPGGKIDYDKQLWPELNRLITEYNIVEVTYDEYQLHYLMTRLRKERRVWVRDFSQGTRRVLADTQLRDIVAGKKYWHRNDPRMREHISNADAKIDEQDQKLRIVKRTEDLKVDGAVAASMGSYEVLRLNL